MAWDEKSSSYAVDFRTFHDTYPVDTPSYSMNDIDD
jgi:hypothetical protein